MRYTDEEIEEAARRFEKWADEVDPTTVKFESTDDLRAIADANDGLARAEDEVVRARARLREAVEIARLNGRSWNWIAIPLGVSRQAAHQRFARADADDEDRHGAASR